MTISQHLDEDYITGATDGTLIGNTGDRLNVSTGDLADDETGALVVIDYIHHMVHNGKCFSHNHIHSMGNGAVVYHLILTPNDPAIKVHLRHSLLSTGPLVIEFFESPTVSAVGSAASAYNRNRTSATTAGTTIYHGPTITADGTKLSAFSIGSSGGNKQGAASDGMDFMLNDNTYYLFKYTSGAAGNEVSEDLFWYEEGA